MSILNWLKQNWRKVTVKKVLNFFGAYWNKYRYDRPITKSTVSTQTEFINWATSQYKWRKKLVETKSPLCLKNKACVHCGCDMPDKLWEPDACEGGCYPDWMTEEDWSKFNFKQ